MSIHVRVVTPIIPTGLTKASDFEGILSDEDIVDFTELDVGPPSIECGYDAAFAAPDTIAKIMAAERDGADAVVIDCMGDPALIAARECVSIPVLGPCQMAMSLAGTLGHQFSVLSISRTTHASFARRARIYGSAENYASTRSVEISVAELATQNDLLRDRLLVAAREAIELDGADTLIIGCTRMFAADELRNDLRAVGLDVPIIDPVPATIKLAKTLVELGLGHSKYAYPTPAWAKKEQAAKHHGDGNVTALGAVHR